MRYEVVGQEKNKFYSQVSLGKYWRWEKAAARLREVRAENVYDDVHILDPIWRFWR